MRKRAVIFDFDGTVADTIPVIREGINLTMEQYGFPTHTDAEVRTYINNGPRMLIRRALPESVREGEDLLLRVLADYNDLYRKVCLHTDKPYDGIPESIAELRAQGYRIGVLSNKQDVLVGPLCETVIPDLYDATLGSLPDHPAKPDPYMPNRIAEQLGVSVTDCILIGDSDVDVLTAKNAGMGHIGVTWGYRSADCLREVGATVLVDTPKDLTDAINQYFAGKEL